MSTEPKCPQCGGTEFVNGAVQSAGTVSFRPKTDKLIKLGVGNVTLTARACLSCGHVEMSAPVKELNAITGRKKESAKADTT